MSSAPDFTEGIVGEWGKWQLCLTIYIFVSKFSVAQHQIAIIYLAPKMSKTCGTENVTDFCSSDCDEVIYDRSIFSETIESDFDLICGRTYLKDLTQSLVMLGILIGNMSAGFFSDKFGRKFVLASYITLQTVCGLLCTIGPYYWLFMGMKFLSTIGTGGQMVTSYVLLVELVGKKHKTIIGALYQLPFNIGHLSLPMISYFLRNWRWYQIAFSATTLPLLTYFCFLPESPRWLLAHDAPARAVKVLTKAAKCNKLPTNEIQKEVDGFMEKLKSQPSMASGKERTFLLLFKTKIMVMYTFCICFNWFICGLCYYGVSQYVGELGGDVFMNVAISAALAIPGTVFVVYSAKSWGRKATTMFMNMCAAIPLLIIVFVPEEPIWIKPVLASASMFGLFGLFCNVYIYAGELFPTKARNVGIGLCSLVARVGSMIAPYIKSADTTTWLAPLVFGAFPFAGFFITFPLPETKDNSLPNTLEEAEDQYRNRKGFFR